MRSVETRRVATRFSTRIGLVAACTFVLAAVFAPSSWAIGINFQPQAVPNAPGYLVDSGKPFAVRGNGYSYGWKAGTSGVDLSAAARDRNSADSPDQRYDTNIAFSFSASPYWEIALPNGSYRVHVVAGDPVYYAGRMVDITLEGAAFAKGATDSLTRWIDHTGIVTVSDGQLTLRGGPTAVDNVVSFIDIGPAAVDTTAPDTTISTGPSGPTNDSSPVFTLTSNEAGAKFQCRVDTAVFVNCTSPFSPAALSDGSHSVAVRSIDAAGNVDATPALRSFSVDTRQPLVTARISSGAIGGTTAAGQPTNVSTAGLTVALSSDESGSFRCRIDADPYAVCGSPWSSGPLAAGSHVVSIVGFDPAGNAAVVTLTVNAVSSTPSPQGLSLSAPDFAHVNVQWSNAPAFTRAVIARDGVTVGIVPAGTTSFRDSQLWYSTTYSYAVSFRNSAGGVISGLGPKSITTPKMPNASATMPNGVFPVEFPNSTAFSKPLASRRDTSSAGASYEAYVRSHAINPNLTLRAYGIPIYETHPTDPTMLIQTCEYGGCTLNDAGRIPVPFDAQADPSADRHLTLVNRQANLSWDFFKPDISAPGIFRTSGCAAGPCPATRGGALSNLGGSGSLGSSVAGANAANLASLAGLIRPEEIAQGRIDHAVVIAMPGIGTASPRCPATHSVSVRGPLSTDSVSESAPPEGTLFKLDPSLDVASLAIPQWQKTIARAMQVYGTYVRDNGGALSIYAESSTTTLGGRHYDAWDKIGDAEFSSQSGYPASAQLSAAFPWNRLLTQLPPC
jgi:hypothetical protein